MTRVPPFLGELSNEDAAWFVDVGVQRRVPAGEAIILEGEQVTELFLILNGSFSVASKQVQGMPEIRLGPGEIAGEMTFVRRHERPLSSVCALEDATVLCIPWTALDEKLAADPGFEARFHKVVSEFTVARLYGSWVPPLPRAPEPPAPPVETLRVYELIEKMLNNELPVLDPPPEDEKNKGRGGERKWGRNRRGGRDESRDEDE